MRQRRRNRLAHDGEDDDPMSVVSNLFDGICPRPDGSPRFAL